MTAQTKAPALDLAQFEPYKLPRTRSNLEALDDRRARYRQEKRIRAAAPALLAECKRQREAQQLIFAAYSSAQKSTPANLRRAIDDAKRVFNGEPSHTEDA